MIIVIKRKCVKLFHWKIKAYKYKKNNELIIAEAELLKYIINK